MDVHIIDKNWSENVPVKMYKHQKQDRIQLS